VQLKSGCTRMEGVSILPSGKRILEKLKQQQGKTATITWKDIVSLLGSSRLAPTPTSEVGCKEQPKAAPLAASRLQKSQNGTNMQPCASLHYQR